MRLVQDTNVFVAALRSGAGASRVLLRKILVREHQALIGLKLWLEYGELTGRAGVWPESVTPEQRASYLNALAAACEFVPVPSVWRPNLADEGDNHVMELALHGHAGAIVTFNLRDFKAALFAPAGLDILRPDTFLKRYSP